MAEREVALERHVDVRLGEILRFRKFVGESTYVTRRYATNIELATLTRSTLI